MNVRLRKDEKIRVLNGIDLYNVMVNILKRSSKIDQRKEHFWIVGLDVTQEILFIELVQLGGKALIDATPNQIFNLALRKDATQIVLVHSVPSGIVKPTDEIKELTGKMVNVGEYLDVPVWDHLIITEKTYFSFLDADLLDIVASTVKVPATMKEHIIKAEAEQEGLIIKLSKSVIKLSQLGMTPETISSVLDLPEWEVESILKEHDSGELDFED